MFHAAGPARAVDAEHTTTTQHRRDDRDGDWAKASDVSGARQRVRWAAKGGLAILDQGLFAGANFVANILLARWLTPEDYGAFALAYSIFLLFAAFHTAILTEPMMVFGAGMYAGKFDRYLGILLRGHAVLMVPASLVLAGVALLLGRLYSPSVERAFLGLALAAGFILLLWLLRKVFYVTSQPGWAVLGSATYCAGVLACTCLLQASGRLSPWTAFLGIACASLAAAALLLSLPRSRGTADEGGLTPDMVRRQHWGYGQWSMATAALMWFPGNIYYAVLPAWIGLQGAGALRALMNLAMPVTHSISALTMLLLPRLVRDRQQGGPEKMDRTMRVALALFFSGCALDLGLLWMLGSQALQFLYAGKYTEYAGWPLLLVGLLPFAASLTAILGGALRALERPDSIFSCYVGSSIAAFLVGLPLAWAFGLTGAMGGALVSALVTGVWMYRFYKAAQYENRFFDLSSSSREG